MLFRASASFWIDICVSSSSLFSVLIAIATVSCVVLFSWLKVYQFMLMVLSEKRTCTFQDLHTRNFRLAVCAEVGCVSSNKESI